MSKIPNIKNQIHPGFETLKKEVLPLLEMYQDDILVYDKEALVGYKGRFISTYRSTGTHIFLIDNFSFVAKKGKKGRIHTAKEVCENDLLFLAMDKHFLLVAENGSSRKITKKEVISLLERQKEEAIKLAQNINDLGFDVMARELFWFIQMNGRAWKSKLREQWQENATSPALTRVRNRFNSQFLLKFNKDSSQEDIENELVKAYVENKQEL